MKEKSCQNCQNNFTITPDDLVFYEKIGVPEPTHCPKCRRIRRLSWRNDYTLYNRNCTFCDVKFVSIYAPNTPFKVLCPKCFYSDKFSGYDYSMSWDKKRSFIEQVVELYKNTPVLGIMNDNDIASVNCLYTNDVAFSKNCIMTFIAWRIENVLYSTNLAAGRELCDCMCIDEESEFTYEAIASGNVSTCKNVYWCSQCVNCIFCYDCRGTQDSFMCFGLRNKKYYFKNEQYTKEEYKKIIDSYRLETRSGYNHAKKEYLEFISKFPRKFAELKNSVDCTGTDITRGKNTRDSNFASFSEDSRFVHEGVSFKSCYDCAVGGETELAYECITPDQGYMSIATIESWKNNYTRYSIDCHSCSDVLGCVGLKKGEYSILNTRYSKEEYEKLFAEIVIDMKKRGEWGEFFPINLSPFGINETRAIEELNFSKEEALAQGFLWQDEIQQTKGRETLGQENIPDSIDDVSDVILKEILECSSCSRNYKILTEELLFYRRLKIPIPEKCFFCRHLDRLSFRGGFDLNTRECDCVKNDHSHENRCGEIFETFFKKDKESRPIYCESCYNQEIN